MDKKIKAFIEKYQLAKEKAIILAVSGGPDSIVLLDLFIRLFPKEKIIVAHANHGLRAEARWDESFVCKLAQEYGVEYVSECLHLSSTSEAAAREARYEFLNRVRDDYGANYVLTAHHLNDQVETVILSLTRGSGPLSVWGMNEREGQILRPLLGVTKKEILKYAKARHLRYHVDRSNFNTKYARNRVRTKVIPQLEKLNPRFLETLKRNAELGREMEEAWGKVIQEKEKRIAYENGLEIKKLEKEPPYIQKELLKRKLSETVTRKEGITMENVNRVYDLLFLSRGKRTEIGGIEIVKGTKYLTFGKKLRGEGPKTSKFKIDESVHFNSFVLKATKGSGKATKNNILLPSSIGYNLNIRTWRDGDRLKTKSGTKKLSDIFTDAKVSAAERQKWPIVTAGKKIIWVPRLAASAEALPESKKNILKIEVRSERKKK